MESDRCTVTGTMFTCREDWEGGGREAKRRVASLGFEEEGNSLITLSTTRRRPLQLYETYPMIDGQRERERKGKRWSEKA